MFQYNSSFINLKCSLSAKWNWDNKNKVMNCNWFSFGGHFSLLRSKNLIFEGQENNNDILINLKVRRNMPSFIFVPKILIFWSSNIHSIQFRDLQQFFYTQSDVYGYKYTVSGTFIGIASEIYSWNQDSWSFLVVWSGNFFSNYFYV